MVVASPTPIGSEKIRSVGVPVIDLSRKRSHVSELVVKACEDYGFFKVINHGVPDETISRMEAEGQNFFARPASEKQRAGPPNPLGYGCRNIGFNGDTGEVEYLLLHTNPLSISQRSRTFCKDPMRFCCVVNDYIEAVQGLACEILDLLAEGLRLHDRKALTNGRFLSVRHRAMANSYKARMSMIYFGAPPLHARISPLPEMVTPINPCLYRPFTWSEYKKAAYSLRLGDARLDLFRSCPAEDDQ
uniref:GA2ox6 n=1 Tax=Liriodendron chinense TaxID=3414 RepID=A0A977LL38_LIRCH|nr:GA2ox6 [Liriodendron chinense]